jgi:hypothetical protein
LRERKRRRRADAPDQFVQVVPRFFLAVLVIALFGQA